MLYGLTQHSLWSQKHYPFLLCKCRRGQAVRNYSTHRYRIIKDKEHLKLYEKSKEKFELQLLEYNGISRYILEQLFQIISQHFYECERNSPFLSFPLFNTFQILIYHIICNKCKFIPSSFLFSMQKQS